MRFRPAPVTEVRVTATPYVALLRGVNIGGVRIPMADLRALLQQLGLGDVRTYVQSGNAAFSASGGDAGEIAAAISAGIAERFGYRIAVLVLTAHDMARIAGHNPFLEAGADQKHLYATFPLEPVSEETFSALRLPAVDGEVAMLAGRVVLLHLPHGYGRSRLNNLYFEKALKVPATTRNWRTVLALRGLCEDRQPA